ncbi:MAG: hypothetical protein R6U44_11495 [Archaeoglobaceae archaeon]
MKKKSHMLTSKKFELEQRKKQNDADLTGLGFGGITGEYKVKDDKVRLHIQSTYIEFEKEGDALVYGTEKIMEWRFVKE